MPKRLVICCDGTWNDPEDRTHIFRIYEAARRLRRKDPDLEVYYDKGVGTRLGQIVLGGSVGIGLSRNVREAYRWLLARYRDKGDSIYLFGFSRGAFTVRSLAGLVYYAGLLRPQDEAHVETAWEAYKSRFRDTTSYDAGKRRLDGIGTRRTSIRFVGVFDTVGALGIPINFLQKILVAIRPGIDARFHDTELRNVDIARHALAIDERRGPFEPALWTRRAGSAPEGDVRQVWFPGVHSDIGGGYEDKRLAEVPLVWMLDEAAAAGLDLFSSFDADPLFPHCGGCAHDSLKGPYRVFPRCDRPIGASRRRRGNLPARLWRRLRGQPEPPAFEVVGEYVHCSALERIHGKVVAGLLPKDRPYAPRGLRPDTGVPVLGRCPQGSSPLAQAAPATPPCRECAVHKGAA